VVISRLTWNFVVKFSSSVKENVQLLQIKNGDLVVIEVFEIELSAPGHKSSQERITYAVLCQGYLFTQC
jgi:hypothetical protein